MKKVVASVVASGLVLGTLALYACASDAVPDVAENVNVGADGAVVDAGADGNAPDAVTSGEDGGVVCRPGERAIRLVNNCASTDIWVGWAGNDGTAGCQSNAECPPGSTCNTGTKKCESTTSANCASAKDCPAVNQFCNAGTPSYTTTCNSVVHCNAGKNEFCNTSQTGYFALKGGGAQPANTCGNGSLTDAGIVDPVDDLDCLSKINAGEFTDTTAKHAFCDNTVAGGNRCAFHQCGTNKCYFAPVPVQTIPPTATSCTKPSDCTDPSEFCYVPEGVPIGSSATATGSCVKVPTTGVNSQKLTHPNNPEGVHEQTICVPTPWAGRFWPRTGCTPKANGELSCETGNCLGQTAGAPFAESCALSGVDSPTLAEFYFPPFGAGTNGTPGAPDDFYDVSLVDGVTIPMQIAPSNYDATSGRTADACDPAKDTCAQTHDVAWACDPVARVCVNKFQCASPGCVSNCSQYGNGAVLGADHNCTWTGELGMTEQQCPTALRAYAPGTTRYIGCLSPKDYCAKPGSDPGICTPSNIELFGCNGPATKVSCYDPTATPTCCGCPSWMPDAGTGSCHATNSTWEANAGKPYYEPLHAACPTAYTFPFDDKSATFTCRAVTAKANVNYTVTFCPK